MLGEIGHVNNLYNTTFWNMVKGNETTPGMSTTEAELALKVSFVFFPHLESKQGRKRGN